VEVNGIHNLGPNDLDVDTTAGVDAELVDAVATAWRRRIPSGGVLTQPQRATRSGGFG
jgi:hypothetical protein